MPKYKFVGDGAGVPGLPHEIAQAEIDQFNPEQLAEFDAALASGLYVEVTDEPVRSKPKKSREHVPAAEGE